MIGRSPTRGRSRTDLWTVGLGAAGITGSALAIGIADPNVKAALPVAAVVTIVVIAVYGRLLQLPSGRSIALVAVAGLALRGIGAIVQHAISSSLYNGADAIFYHRVGLDVARELGEGKHRLVLPGGAGTRIIELIVGWFYYLVGPSRLGVTILFVVLAWLGLVLFVIGATRVLGPSTVGFARFVMLLPSMWFWPSVVGKESVMLFALGLLAWGLTLRGAGRAVAIAAGIGIALAVRPHVALIAFAAVVTAYSIRRMPGRSAPVRRIAMAVPVVLIGYVVLHSAASSFEFENVSRLAGLYDKTASATATGGSTFTTVNVLSPLGLPLAFITVLFRPLPFDVRSLQAAVVSVEVMFVLGFVLRRRRYVAASLRAMRTSLLHCASATYVVAFCIVFSALGNFGILARQRVQVLPFLALLCFVPHASDRSVTTPAGLEQPSGR